MTEDNVQTVAADAFTKAQSESRNGTDPARITLLSGIVLECKAVPPLFLRHVNTQIPQPKPPKVFIPEKEREEENPNDPQFLADLIKWGQDADAAVRNLLLLAGTKTVEVPEGVYADSDPQWYEEVKVASDVINIEPPTFDWENDAKRRLAWLCYYAIGSSQELLQITNTVGQLSGVREQDVAEAMASFRGRKGRGADPGPADAERGEDGDNVQAPDGGDSAGSGSA